MFSKLPWPKTGIEAVDRSLSAILDRLLRFELVGNFFGTPTNGQVPTYNAAEKRWEPKAPGGSGVTDHGALTGLPDDDHPQYHNDSRGDARYYTQSQVDALLPLEATIGITIDGGGSAITTGVKGDVRVPFDCTITGWDIVADQTGSIVIDVWRDSYANFPPTSLDSITGTEKPTLSSAQKNQDTALSSWSTTLTADQWLRFNVDSAATITRATLQLRVTKT